MNSQEAINALFEGKYVRRSSWTNRQYIYLRDGKFPTYVLYDAEGGFESATQMLFQYNDWEICKEMYQWLCYDNVQKEFFLSDYIEGEMKYALGETKYKVIKRLDETRKVFK